MRSSFALLPALAAAVYGQGSANTPQAETTVTSAIPTVGCNACFIVANVAQVIFADFTQVATASAVVSVGNGLNGTRVTTRLTQPAQTISFGPSGLLGGSAVAASYVPISGTVLEINGATLTSPTAYNVFTAYTSFTQSLNAAGSCVSVAGTTSILSNASSYIIPVGAAPASEIMDAETLFKNAIGGVTCLAGGVIVSSTVPFIQSTTTVTSTTSAPARPTSLPVTSSAPTAAAATTSASSSASSSSSSSSSSTTSTTTSIVLLTPTPTIIITGAASTLHSIFHPRAFSATTIAALLVIPGIAAWML